MTFEKIKYLVFTPELKDSGFVQSAINYNVPCIPVIDARSAVYVATGISAQNREVVVVCLDSGNTSRSAFSGLTEAYYRNLPVVLITFGSKLDYSKELRDVVYGHYIVRFQDQINELLETKLPIHIEWQTASTKTSVYRSKKIYDSLKKILDKEVYLYIGQGIDIPEQTFSCRVVRGGMINCLDGAVANVLGASLAKKHKRYIGLISEEEYVHDLNTLGNIHINDMLMFIVVVQKTSAMLEGYAKSLGFKVYTTQEKEMEISVRNLIFNGKKTVLFVLRET